MAAFCQESETADASDDTHIAFKIPELPKQQPTTVKPKNKQSAEYARYSAMIFKSFGIALMGISTIPLTATIGVAVYYGSYGFQSGISYSMPVFNLFSLTLLSGGMFLYAGFVKAMAAHPYSSDNYRYEVGKAMRIIGAVYLATSVMPLSTAIQNLLGTFGLPTAWGMTDPIVDIIYCAVNFAMTAVHLALGTAVLSVGCYRIAKFLGKYTPEVTLIHNDKQGKNGGYDMSFGMRVKI